MRFCLMSEPQQGLSYEDILALTRAAEEAGFEAYFRSDHYASFPGGAGKPTTDAWATLAGLARETARINLGVLVSPVTFRLPGNLAKVVTTVAEMSDGRVEVGLGAGWNEEEHRQLGLRFPPTGERFDMLEEQLAILHGLWTEPDGWSYEGRHWQLADALFYPKPPARDGRRHPNILAGGAGGPRMARLVAQYADELNISSAAPAKIGEAFARLDGACRDVDRDPAEVTRSAMTGVLVGRNQDEVRRRVRELMAALGDTGDGDAEAWLAERRQRWVIGTPDEARRQVATFEEAGAQRLMLQDFLPRDLEMVALLGEVLIEG
ncbi:MAG TPA: TIGR03560 family F420-dependent LLM class oxidoreductase [Candidatus Limnocylindria bacterium]|nr:TIGR03560 family F420-dependent LLM class oxidoreductase [Candidatus Limnocylindria bacterium]